MHLVNTPPFSYTMQKALIAILLCLSLPLTIGCKKQQVNPHSDVDSLLMHLEEGDLLFRRGTGFVGHIVTLLACRYRCIQRQHTLRGTCRTPRTRLRRRFRPSEVRRCTEFYRQIHRMCCGHLPSASKRFVEVHRRQPCPTA